MLALHLLITFISALERDEGPPEYDTMQTFDTQKSIYEITASIHHLCVGYAAACDASQR